MNCHFPQNDQDCYCRSKKRGLPLPHRKKSGSPNRASQRKALKKNGKKKKVKPKKKRKAKHETRKKNAEETQRRKKEPPPFSPGSSESVFAPHPLLFYQSPPLFFGR